MIYINYDCGILYRDKGHRNVQKENPLPPCNDVEVIVFKLLILLLLLLILLLLSLRSSSSNNSGGSSSSSCSSSSSSSSNNSSSSNSNSSNSSSRKESSTDTKIYIPVTVKLVVELDEMKLNPVTRIKHISMAHQTNAMALSYMNWFFVLFC